MYTISKNLECNLLLITHSHILLCHKYLLELYDFDGNKINEWKMNSVIRYIKNISGPVAKEGILCGLKNGEIYTIFINQKYPIFHYKHSLPIRCLDISSSRNKISIVDDKSQIIIYNLNSNKILYKDTNANSVSFNDEFDDIFAYSSSNNVVTIKNYSNNKENNNNNNNFEYKCKMKGFIVRFNASTVYCLYSSNNNKIESFKIPQSEPLKKYIFNCEFDNAFKIISLGITKYEILDLGLKCLESMRFDLAKKVFSNLSNICDIIKYSNMVNYIELEYKNQNNKTNNNTIMGDIFAYQGQFDKAEKIYCNNNEYRKAIEMYLDLRKWDNAKDLIKRYQSNEDNKEDNNNNAMNDLLIKQAKWLKSNGDYISSADLYWSAKQYISCVAILFKRNKYDMIKSKVLSLIASTNATNDTNEILIEFYEFVIQKFLTINDIKFIKKVYLLTKNYTKLIEIHIEREEWDEAFVIINEHKEVSKDILLPYAKWLAFNDRFDEASTAFYQAGYPKYAIKMLNNLTKNCLIQKKYNDAAYYYWLLSVEHLKFNNNIRQFNIFRNKSLLYYAYNIVYEYIQSPFTSYTPQILFNAARFAKILYEKDKDNCDISVVSLLYILAKQCITLKAYKLARNIISSLIQLKIPISWRNNIELDALLIRTKPFSDPQHLSSYICARCSTSNNYNTLQCTHCNHKFIQCMISFQNLPLVEFKIVNNLSHDEAIKLIKREPPTKNNQKLFNIKNKTDENEEKTDEQINIMNFDDDDDNNNNSDIDDTENDLFYQQLMSFDSNDNDDDDDNNNAAIILDGLSLEKIAPNEIFVIDYRKYCNNLEPKYYRCIVPEESYDIIICPNCYFLFRGEEYEIALINNGHICPFCRHKFENTK